MIRLQELEQVMKSQFVWNKDTSKRLETDEATEGSKDLARNIFVGLSNVYGFEASDVCEYLDMGYDSYRHKLSMFREYYKEGKQQEMSGTISMLDERVRRFYTKVCLCMNAIRTHMKKDQYYKLENL